MRRNTLVARTLAVGVASIAAVALAACSSSGPATSPTTSKQTTGDTTTPSTTSSSSGGSLPGAGKPSFVLGDKNFPEQYLLGYLYADALKAQGYDVTLKPNLGSSEIADAALQSGKIDGIPEYTGVIYTELAHLGDRPKSAAETLAGATKYEKGRGFTVLKPTPFQDADGFAVSKDYAAQHHLTTIADMKNVGTFSYGGPPENRTRYQGVVGLKDAYGLNNIDFKPLSIGAQYTALDQGQVDSIAIFTTDGQLASGKYKVLTDTKGIFGYQNVVPVINTKKLKAEGPAFAETCNKVSALLTTKAILLLNKYVQIDKKDPQTIADAFLKANGLLS